MTLTLQIENFHVLDDGGPVSILVPERGIQVGRRSGMDWVLPDALEKVRRKLKGVDDGDRQMVDILAAVLTEGLPAVEAACAEAIAQGVHSSDVILNILARRRDPAPPPLLLTSPALRLAHEPVADCTRYDLLRRAG